ncbi:MAG TPA: prolipoprotein diacylglyceryl transferase [Anaerolineae bacterium]|nr:prolipoprotein diacylglyceryl transferase [Anaerolineae bacterium]
MFPILFTIGEIQISSSHFFLVLGILVGLGVGWIEARRVGISDRHFHTFWLSAVPLALLFAALNARIFKVGFSNALQNLGSVDYLSLVSFGAVLGVLFWGAIYARLTKVPTGLILDTVATVLPLILSIYRIGCILTGCCYGLETDGFFSFYLPGRHGVWAPRYPTQIMLFLFNMILFLWLWMRRKRKAFAGQQVLILLIIYSLGRLAIDALRDLPRILGPFSLHQLTAMAILLISSYTAFELWRERRASQA